MRDSASEMFRKPEKCRGSEAFPEEKDVREAPVVGELPEWEIISEICRKYACLLKNDIANENNMDRFGDDAAYPRKLDWSGLDLSFLKYE